MNCDPIEKYLCQLKLCIPIEVKSAADVMSCCHFINYVPTKKIHFYENFYKDLFFLSQVSKAGYQ